MTPKKYRNMNHMVHWDIGAGENAGGGDKSDT